MLVPQIRNQTVDCLSFGAHKKLFPSISPQMPLKKPEKIAYTNKSLLKSVSFVSPLSKFFPLIIIIFTHVSARCQCSSRRFQLLHLELWTCHSDFPHYFYCYSCVWLNMNWVRMWKFIGTVRRTHIPASQHDVSTYSRDLQTSLFYLFVRFSCFAVQIFG